MSHSICGGLHSVDLISTEDERATHNNRLHATEAAENHLQGTLAFPCHGWHVPSFSRHTCCGVRCIE